MKTLPDINERVVDDRGRLTDQARLYIQQIDSFQPSLGYTPEDVANKQSNLSASATKYPTVNAVNAGLDGKQDIARDVTSASSSGGVLTLDLSDNSSVYQVALTEDITSWVISNGPSVSGTIVEFEVQFTQHASNIYTVNDPATGNRTVDGYWYIRPLANSVDFIRCEVYFDGANTYIRTFPLGFHTSAPMGLKHCRAWARFDATVLVSHTGTYSRTGTSVTVSIVDHKFKVGNIVFMDYTSGAATDAAGLILTVPDKDTFTINHAVSGATSGNCRFRACTLRASFNISHIVFTSAGASSGQYYVNYREFMPDQWSSILYSNGLTNSATSISKGVTLSAAGYCLAVSYLGTTATDTASNSIEVLR